MPMSILVRRRRHFSVVLAAALLASLPITPHAFAMAFTRTDVVLGSLQPRGITTAELDGDGDGDLAVTSRDDSTVSILWMTDLLFVLASGQRLPLVGGGSRQMANEDVVRFDSTADAYQVFFDGSDVGLGTFAIDAMALTGPGELVLSFTQPGSIPGVGEVDDSDLVKFAATSLGETTAGVFSLYFDGSDIGLTTAAEDIDAVEIQDDTIYFSTNGKLAISGGVRGRDEDLVACIGAITGTSSACAGRSLAFDGSAAGLDRSSEDLDAFSLDAIGDHSLFSTTGAYTVNGSSGGRSAVFGCAGAPTICDDPGVRFATVFAGGDHGITENIAALDVEANPPPPFLDLTAPEVVSVEVSPSTAAPGDTLTITAHVTDASGVDLVQLQAQLDGVSDFASWCSGTAQLASGTPQDGMWTRTCLVPDVVNSGTYQVWPFARDALGNWVNTNGGPPTPVRGTFTIVS